MQDAITISKGEIPEGTLSCKPNEKNLGNMVRSLYWYFGCSGGIGVAPGVTWFTARGCKSRSCEMFALLSAATIVDGTHPQIVH